MPCDYEKLRLQNIEDNKKILKELGLLNPFKPLPHVIKKAPKRKRARTPPPEKKVVKKVAIQVGEDDNAEKGSVIENDGQRRRSARVKGVRADYAALEDEAWRNAEAEASDDDEATPSRRAKNDKPMMYGAVAGVEIGTVWQMRSDCSYDCIHRPWVAGIHGGPEGAYSVALSGGYEDDIDMGDCFTFTGEGGRDLKGTSSNPKNLRTAAQTRDQCLSRGNAALVKSVETGVPVRVIRGFKNTHAFAPEEGYRYDGLYKVEKYWFTTGMSGHGVFKFAFRRLEDQPPPPWTFAGQDENNNENNANKNDNKGKDEKKVEVEKGKDSSSDEKSVKKKKKQETPVENKKKSKLEDSDDVKDSETPVKNENNSKSEDSDDGEDVNNKDSEVVNEEKVEEKAVNDLCSSQDSGFVSLESKENATCDKAGVLEDDDSEKDSAEKGEPMKEIETNVKSPISNEKAVSADSKTPKENKTKAKKEKTPKAPKEKTPKVPKEKTPKAPKEKTPKVPKEKTPKADAPEKTPKSATSKTPKRDITTSKGKQMTIMDMFTSPKSKAEVAEEKDKKQPCITDMFKPKSK